MTMSANKSPRLKAFNRLFAAARDPLAAMGVVTPEGVRDRLAMEAKEMFGIARLSQLSIEQIDVLRSHVEKIGGDVNPPPRYLRWRVKPSAAKKPLMAKLSVLLAENNRGWEYADAMARKFIAARKTQPENIVTLDTCDYLTPSELRVLVGNLQRQFVREQAR